MSLLSWLTGAWKAGAWKVGAWKQPSEQVQTFVKTPWRITIVQAENRVLTVKTAPRRRRLS